MTTREERSFSLVSLPDDLGCDEDGNPIHIDVDDLAGHDGLLNDGLGPKYDDPYGSAPGSGNSTGGYHTRRTSIGSFSVANDEDLAQAAKAFPDTLPDDASEAPPVPRNISTNPASNPAQCTRQDKKYQKYPWSLSDPDHILRFQDVINFVRASRVHNCVMCGLDGNGQVSIPNQN